MSVTVRRVIYSLLSALGFALMVPFAIEVRRLGAAELEAWEIGLGAERIALLLLLFLLGLLFSSGFLYAALSAGVPRAWKARYVDGIPRCGRCGAELGGGAPRCAVCEQHIA